MSEIYLVQISDLHFDADIDNVRAARHEGYDAHNRHLCHALMETLFHEHFPEIGECQLVVGGDLTSTGSPDEFRTAATFLRNRHPAAEQPGLRVGTGLGLEHPADRYWTIPGNHDHWEGRWLFPIQKGYSRRLFPLHFVEHPWVATIRSGDLELVLCGIDSNSMFEGFSVNVNPGAGGGFSPTEREIFEGRVARALGRPLEAGVRRRLGAILCHHPLSTDGVEPLRAACASWLLQFAGDHQIPMILTGHTHRVLMQPFPVMTAAGVRKVYEVRAPTTLQTERGLDVTAARDRSLRRPGFWLHRFALDAAGQLTWDTRLYLLSKQTFRWANDQYMRSITLSAC